MSFERLQVKQEKIKVLTVVVVKATNVRAEGFINRFFDIPDPYVILRVRNSPNSRQQTSSKKDNINPEWNETFEFYLNAEKKNTLELRMMDKDLDRDDMIGKKQMIELDCLPLDCSLTVKLSFNTHTLLELKLLVQYDETKELRLSYDLCDEEKDFLQRRKEEILKRIPQIINESKTARNIDEVPTIAIMGSGGGYRAACGLSGVFCALQEAKILDCATYVTGLSGSSWYISSLYMHNSWPYSMTCQDKAEDLKRRFGTSILDHLHTMAFANILRKKRRRGQLVRLTDVFGLVIGNALLPDPGAKLSSQADKVKSGHVPLPLTTGIRVRKDIPAAEFSEWVEFSPFEYGIAKYGVFGKTTEFGCKYYKGRLVRKFEESPLHYLLGIWGSAFGVILNTLNERNGSSDETARKEHEQAALQDADLCKNEHDDSDDESEDDSDEDQIKNANWIAEMLNPSLIFSSRRGRAAEIFNFCRGLEFKREADHDFDHAAGRQKTMCVVDSGIAFNSPFPIVLRPERKVELILSFDFSQREGGDDELPFETLLKAERWAKENRLPFPPIEGNPVLRNPEVQECYVFEDLADPHCPTILHFPLVNKTFKDYVEPGVPRVTPEEKDFGDFKVFDDPDEPYSTFHFKYDGKSFDRLKHLMRYNTLNNMDTIKEKITRQIDFRRNNPTFARR